MSLCYCDGEPAELLEVRETERSRKDERRCDECGMLIQRGMPFRRIRGLWEGEWSTYIHCRPCADLWDSFKELGHCLTYGCFQDDYNDWLEEEGHFYYDDDLDEFIYPDNHLVFANRKTEKWRVSQRLAISKKSTDNSPE